MQSDLNVLLVDDQRENLVEYEGILRQLTDYSVRAVDSSAEAIELCRKEHFDVLVTDVRMPGKNGDEMYAEIKKILPEIRCIVITGFPGQDAPINFLKLGAHDFLFKAEFSPQTLLRSIDNQAQIVRLRHETDVLQGRLAHFHKTVQEIMSTVQSVTRLSRAPELTMSLHYFAELSALISGAPVVAIFLMEPDGSSLVARAAVGAEPNPTPVPLGRGLAGRVAQSARLTAQSRAESGGWPGDEVGGSLEEGRRSGLGIPLVAQGVCIGVLELFDKERFEPEDVELLSRLGALCSSTVDLVNAAQMADNLLLRALKLAAETASVETGGVGEAPKDVFSGMAETVKQIDLVGSGGRATALAEQIRRVCEFGQPAAEFCERILAGLLAMLQSQREAVPEIRF
ncbi:MAG TPA: response regulator [Verrucomicrobiae bacterium]|nr:response regulator [Verrucomicrobiae bacterium]